MNTGGPQKAAVGRSLETTAEAEVVRNSHHLGINDEPSQSIAEDDLTVTFICLHPLSNTYIFLATNDRLVPSVLSSGWYIILGM